MKAEEFCYFLQGLFEVAGMKSCNEEQWETIRRHLALVFIHDIDPKAGDAAHQQKLNEAHSPTQVKTPPFHQPHDFPSGGPLIRC